MRSLHAQFSGTALTKLLLFRTAYRVCGCQTSALPRPLNSRWGETPVQQGLWVHVHHLQALTKQVQAGLGSDAIQCQLLYQP